MSPDFILLILCIVAGIVFGGTRVLLSGKTTAFWIDMISFALAILVVLSRSILGLKL